MGCGVWYTQINELDRALGTLRRFGLEGMPSFNQLSATRAKLMTQIGFKFPREISLLVRLAGLSPGEIKLWHDAEAGFMAEARERPGAPPVYHHVSDDEAGEILTGELSQETHDRLMAPDDYYGE